MLQKFNPKNHDLIVNINGELVHRDKAGVSPFDSAVQGGDAVWEGLRLYNGPIDSNVLRAPFPLSIFHRAKKSSRNSNVRWRQTRCVMVSTSGSRSHAV